MRIIFYSFVIFLIFIISCSRGHDVIVTIDDIKIYQEDIDLRLDVYQKCYKDIEQRDSISVLAELMRDNLELAVLKKAFNLAPPDSALEWKSKWIDVNTKSPEVLNCIKKIYGENTKAYYRNVVSPTMVNNVLFDSFSSDTILQSIQRDSISNMWDIVRSSPEMLNKLKNRDSIKIWKKSRLLEDTVVKKMDMDIPANPLIENVLKYMKPGQIWGNVIEDDYSYQILRLLSENDSLYICEGVIIEKYSYGSWFQEFVNRNVKVKFFDEGLKSRFLKKFPEIWWKNIIE